MPPIATATTIASPTSIRRFSFLWVRIGVLSNCYVITFTWICDFQSFSLFPVFILIHFFLLGNVIFYGWSFFFVTFSFPFFVFSVIEFRNFISISLTLSQFFLLLPNTIGCCAVMLVLLSTLTFVHFSLSLFLLLLPLLTIRL